MFNRHLCRKFHVSSRLFSNKLKEFAILKDTVKPIKSVTNTGFIIDDIHYKGPIAIVESKVFLWDVPQYGVGGPKDDVEPLAPQDHDDPSSPFYGWNSDMLELFKLIDPKPELLLVGSGGTAAKLPKPISEFLNQLGIPFEVSASRNAGSTYNEMIQEGRRVAVALLPPIPTSARTGKVLVELHST